jgi:hypothetical protein
MAEDRKEGFPLALVGIGLGAIYWFVDSLLDIFLTDNLDLFSHLLSPDLSSIYRRLIVICLLVMFGSHSQSKLNAFRDETEEWMAYSQQLEGGAQETANPAAE